MSSQDLCGATIFLVSTTGLYGVTESAEAGEVKGDDDMLTVGGKDFDGGLVAVDIAGIILQPDIPADEAPGISARGAATIEGGVAEGYRRMKG